MFFHFAPSLSLCCTKSINLVNQVSVFDHICLRHLEVKLLLLWNKGSGHWGRQRGAILGLVQHLNVDILDNIGQEAVDEAPDSPCVVTLNVVMVEIR